jgi:hypothetical protein
MDEQLRAVRRRRMRQVTGFGIFSVLALSTARVPAVVIVPVMIVVLAGVDIAGGIVAKSWALGRSPWMFATGVALFALLFWIYGISLRHGELSTVTIGWVVLVTLADMGLDRFHYGVQFPTSKWLAALGAVALLAYLLVGTQTPVEHPVEHGSTAATPLEPVTSSVQPAHHP